MTATQHRVITIVGLVLTAAATLLTTNADIFELSPSVVAVIGTLASAVPTIIRQLTEA